MTKDNKQEIVDQPSTISKTDTYSINKNEVPSKNFIHVVGSDEDVNLSIGINNVIKADQVANSKNTKLCLLSTGGKWNWIEDCGVTAVKNGCIPYVKEVSSLDSIKSEAELDSISSTPFLYLYADKKFEQNQETAIVLVCQLLTYLPLKAQQTYLYAFKKKYRKFDNVKWNKTLSIENKKRRGVNSQKTLEPAIFEGEGLNSNGKHYYTLDKNGKEISLSNFVIIPIAFVEGEDKTARIMLLKNEMGNTAYLEVGPSDITHMKKFQEVIEKKGNFVIRPSMTQNLYCELKEHIYGSMPKVYLVGHMGYSNTLGKEFYAFANGIYFNQKWIPLNEFGFANLDSDKTVYIPAMSRMHVNDSIYKEQSRYIVNDIISYTAFEYFQQLVRFYGCNAMACIAYYISSLFRDIIFKEYNCFPILFITGRMKAGKSTLAELLLLLFQQKFKEKNLDGASLYAIGDILNSVYNFPVHFDEYMDRIDVQKMDLLKGNYNSVGRTKRSDTTGERMETESKCALIILGQEMPTRDEALFDRVLHVGLPSVERSVEDKNQMSDFLAICRGGLVNITIELLKYRNYFVENWSACYRESLKEFQGTFTDYRPSDRTINHWAMMLATISCAEKAGIELPFSYSEFFRVCQELIRNQYEKTSYTDEVSAFWKRLETAFQSYEIIPGRDFIIKTVDKLSIRKGSGSVEKDFKSTKKILFLRFQGSYGILKNSCHCESAPEASVCNYLKNSSEYLGERNSPMDFKMTNKIGQKIEEQKYDCDSGSTVKFAATRVRPLCFDYEELKKRRDIDLEVSINYKSTSSSIFDDMDSMNEEPANPESKEENVHESELPF